MMCQNQLEKVCPRCSCSPKCEICKRAFLTRLTAECKNINIELLYCGKSDDATKPVKTSKLNHLTNTPSQLILSPVVESSK